MAAPHRRPRPRAVPVLVVVGVFAGVFSSCASPVPPQAQWGATVGAPCDGLDGAACMLPYPDDYYTVPDPGTVTGLRLYFPPGALPASASGVAFDTAPLGRDDGFSPGSTILTHIPGLGLAASGMATLSDIGASLAPDAPVVLLDATTMRRQAYWAELDAAAADPDEQLLMIHPAKSLTEGDRYIVALRGLRTAGGAAIAPESAFAAVLASDPARSAPAAAHATSHAAAHATHLQAVLATLRHDGVSRTGMFLAWDFTVMSTHSLTAPALSMRNQSFAALHGSAPRYSITAVADDPAEFPDLARAVAGTVDVPSYLNEPGGPPGSVLHYGSDGLPVQMPGNVQRARFVCEIPLSASPTRPARIALYGPGLLSSAAEVTNANMAAFASRYDVAACATDWLGLSASDESFGGRVAADANEFHSVADRLTQSLLDAQFLGRLLDDRFGFAANPAFRSSGRPLIDPRAPLVYVGASLGAIEGGAVTALSTDIRRSVLVVPGMDFDLLADRSADAFVILGLLSKSYPDRLDQQVLLDVLQMEFDRGEADGYAAQMTTHPLPGTPRHQVLLAEAFGDHEVANVATETEARTIGADVHEPALDPGRSDEAVSFWGIPPLPLGPTRGPALYVWDSGAPAPPLTDTAPTAGVDPHGTVPTTVPAFWQQMDTFFVTGEVDDPCGTDPCTASVP